jgi:membrane-bound serine protease (ClpP class)
LIEFYNPGSIFPGVIGIISAIIAGFSLQMLPVNYAGLALMVVSIVLFIMEVKIVSFGLLSLGGVVTFLLGSIMLIDSPGDFMSIGLGIIIPSTAVTAALFIGVVYLAVKSQRKKVSSGVSTLVGKEVVVFSDIKPPQLGKVKVTGEIWKAKAIEQMNKGEFANITAVDGLTLTVKKIEKS